MGELGDQTSVRENREKVEALTRDATVGRVGHTVRKEPPPRVLMEPGSS